MTLGPLLMMGACGGGGGVPALPAVLTSGNTVFGLTATFNTASMSGESGLVLLVVGLSRTSSAPAAPTSVSGLGLSWSLVDGGLAKSGGISRSGLWVYAAVGTPTTGTISIESSYTQANAAASWIVAGFAGGTGVVQSDGRFAVTSDNTSTLTLAPFADSNNYTVVAVCTSSAGTGTPFEEGDGLTQLADEASSGTAVAVEVFYQLGANLDPNVTATSSVNHGEIAMEIGV